MPNGNESTHYVKAWCDERHNNLQTDIREIKDDLIDIRKSITSINRKLDNHTPGGKEVTKAQASFWVRARVLLPWLIAALGIGAGIGSAIRTPSLPVAPIVETSSTTPGK